MADYNPKTLVLEKDSNTYSYASGPFYAECSTSAGTQTKSVTISEIKELTKGLSVRIKFINAQSYNGQAKLQINSFTAVNIVRMGTTASARYEWQAGEILDLTYDGTNFIIQEGSIPTTTYYGSRVKLSSSTSSTSEVLAATPKAVKAAYDLANGKVSCNTENVKSALGTGENDNTFLRKDGTWSTPVDMRPIIVELGTLSNVSGSYTNTFTSSNVSSIANVVAGMKPIVIECGNPAAFKTAPTITTGDNSITVQCDNFEGSSTVTVTLAQAIDATSATTYQLTSAEATTLQGQVGNPTSLTTTNKSNLVSAVNELNGNMNKLRVPETETDLNNITEAKVSWATDTTANRPIDWCIVYTYKMNNNIMSQVAHCTTKSTMYYRCKTNGTWQAWEELALNSNTTPVTVQLVDDTYNFISVVRTGKCYTVNYTRKTEVPNTTEVCTIVSEAIPDADLGAFTYYKQNSGYSLVEAVLQTNGKIKLLAAHYNEPLAGSFTWTYTKA